MAEEAGLTLVWEEPAEEVWAGVDPFRMQQVLLNLVHNAIKYTPHGGTITVTLAREGDQEQISVADTGVGIAPDALSRIFRIFQQEQSGAERKGLGIGLAFVSSLVELHGGYVWAESEGVGRGSRFVVSLPVCPPGIGENAPPNARASSRRQNAVVDRAEVGLVRPAGSPSVLLVEDNPDSREAIREVLEILGYTVRKTCCAEDALALLEEWRPDILLFDIGLPGQSGLDLIRQVRRQPGLEQLPALAITGYGTDADRQEALSAGFNGHIVKPLAIEELDRAMQGLLRARH